jgi:pimeloyl-ACP methyl ester carboxylesterase
MTGTTALTTGVVTVNGVRSPYLQSGDAGAETAVVYLHGNPGSSGDFRRLVAETGAFSRALAIDMPGFGKADRPADFPYNVRGYAAHLAASLEQLGVRRAQLVMHDFGGGWGLAWAALHPQQTISLTLINTGVTLGYKWHYAARLWQTPIVGELFMATTTRSAFGLMLNVGQKTKLPAAFIDEMYGNFDSGAKRAVLKLYRAHANASSMVGELVGALKTLNVPVLVIWGKRDPYLPVKLAQRQAEVFSNIRYVWLEDAAHWPFIDDRQGVAAALLPFLRQNGS